MSELNTRVEYDAPDGQRWKVELAEALQSQLVLKPEQLTEFHKIACRCEKGWRILRLIYGVTPLVSNVRSDADYMKANERWEVAKKLNITAKAIDRELAVVKAVWRKSQGDAIEIPPETDIPITPPPPPKARMKRKLYNAVPDDEEEPKERRKRSPEQPAWIAMPIQLPPLESPEDQALLDEYGFPNGTFGRIGHDVKERTAERDWFITRLRDMQKLFDEPKMVSSLARMALINEMQLRRLDAKLCMVDADHPKFADLQETKNKIETQLKEQWNAIKEVCPWAVNVENKISFAAVVSDIALAYRDFVGNKDNRRIDGLFTNFEIQCQMRASLQHDIRYRPGQVASIVEAMGHIWDADWKPSMPTSVCKMLDAGLREGCRRLREEAGIELPDLEKDGPSGEYPPIWVAKDEETPKEMEQPVLNVPIDLKS